MNFEVKQNNKAGTITVKVNLTPYNGKNYECCRNGTVRGYLKDNNISFGECINSQVIGNEYGPLTAEWVFIHPNAIIIVDKPPKLVVSYNKARKKHSKSKDE